MFKLVVLIVCAVATIEAGYIGDAYALGHGYGYGSYGYGGHGYGYGHGYAAIPTGISHQSRVDIHSKPIITAVAAAPVIVKPHLVAAIPAATSHQSRIDIHSKPIVYTKPIVTYAAPHVSYGTSYVATSPIVSGLYGSGYHGLGGYGLGYGHGYGYGHGLNYGHGLSYGHGYGHGLYGSHY